MRYFEINPDGYVVNIIVWDGVSEYHPAGLELMAVTDAPVGVTYGWRVINGEWLAPPAEEPSE